jgi:hypothetical protein
MFTVTAGFPSGYRTIRFDVIDEGRERTEAVAVTRAV